MIFIICTKPLVNLHLQTDFILLLMAHFQTAFVTAIVSTHTKRSYHLPLSTVIVGFLVGNTSYVVSELSNLRLRFICLATGTSWSSFQLTFGRNLKRDFVFIN